MRKSKKQLLRTLMACGLVVSVAAGGTVAYLTDAETATNTFTVGKVKIDLEEPGYPGNDSDEVKNIIPNQEIVKDPQIENTGNNDALVFLRVEVPQEEFTELDADNNVGEKKLQDLFKLKNVSGQWELLRTETTTNADGKVKTSYVYGYKKTLAKGSTTDKLFQKVQMKNSIEKDLESNVEDVIVTACAIQATDIPDVNLTPGSDGNLSKDVLDQVYTIFLNQSGNQTSRPADEGDRNQSGKLGKISYELDGGTLADGSLTEYGSADYGYTPPEPTKKNYTFTGWEPENIPAGSTGKVTLTAKWTPNVLGNISYDLDGGSISNEKTSYTTDDYGYVPPIPTKRGFEFTGWNPSSLETDSTGAIVFTAQWEKKVTTLKSGSVIGAQFKKLAGNSSATNRSEDTAITAIQRSNEAPTEAVMADANSLISADDSLKPIYAWYEDGVIKWWSDTEYVNAGASLSYLCYGMKNLTDISGLADWNTSKVTSMNCIFYKCSQITDITPLANWKTEKVTDMSCMFDGWTQLTDITPLANWDTNNVTYMNYMFNDCKQLADITPLANWNTSSVNSLFGVFDGCSNLADLTPLASWNTENVTNMSQLFYGCGQITDLTPLANWNTGKVVTMRYAFGSCKQLADLAPLTNWDTGKVVYMYGMFSGCSQLTDLTPLANWNTGNAKDMGAMFYGCSQLANLTALANWNTNNVTDMNAVFYECGQITDLTPLANWSTENVTNMSSMFCRCGQLTDLTPLANWDTGNVTNMSNMFNGWTKLTDLTPIAGWDTSKVEDMGGVFNGCTNLADLVPLAAWQTNNVTKMNHMFNGCSQLADLATLANWNTSNVTNMFGIFYGCTSLADLTPIANWNVGNITNMGYMFYGCENLTNVSAINGWDISKVTDFGLMFYKCPSHPTFTKRAGNWNSNGTFTPTN